MAYRKKSLTGQKPYSEKYNTIHYVFARWSEKEVGLEEEVGLVTCGIIQVGLIITLKYFFSMMILMRKDQ